MSELRACLGIATQGADMVVVPPLAGGLNLFVAGSRIPKHALRLFWLGMVLFYLGSPTPAKAAGNVLVEAELWATKREQASDYAFFRVRCVDRSLDERAEGEQDVPLTYTTVVTMKEVRFGPAKMDYRSMLESTDGKSEFVSFDRTAFNGQTSMRLTELSEGFFEGTVSQQKFEYDTQRVEIRPLVQCCRSIDVDYVRIDFKNYRVVPGHDMVNGIQAVRLRPQDTSGIAREYWVAPEQDFAVVKIVERFNRKLPGFDIEITNRHYDGFGWAPYQWKAVAMLEDGTVVTSSDVTVVESAIGEGIDESEFVIDFPRGTRLQNRETGELSQVGHSNGLFYWLVASVVVCIGIVIWRGTRNRG